MIVCTGAVTVFVDMIVVELGESVMVVEVTPIHEQALEYRTAPEQAEAYIGIEDGELVT